jgi:ABC-2 type transport system ATP-binding protein
VPRDAIAVADLTRRFGDFTAVDRVTFDVAVGEIFGFLGPNGAGKTTTIKMLTGLLRPSGGTATVAGYDVSTDSAAIRRNIGYMSQAFSLYTDLTVDENIRLFGGLYGVTRERFESRRSWVLAMAGLEAHSARVTGELSLGWKQRLALGCAVLHQPPILFLDEPTSGVDPISRRSFWDLIYHLAEDGTTVLVSTHYMEEAEYCHRLALMNRGKLIALERPHTLKQTLEQPLYELRTDDAASAVAVLRTIPVVSEAAMFGRTVHVMVTDARIAERELPAVLRRAGLRCDDLQAIVPSLEDVFVALVRREGGAALG